MTRRLQVLTNDELKKKIAQIIAEYCCPLGKTHKQLYDAERQCYTEMNFAECKPITECTDALIAAGIGDVKDLQVQVDSLEITNIALQAGYDDAEKDRLYWVNKYKEAEHRAEVAEDVIDEFVERLKAKESPKLLTWEYGEGYSDCIKIAEQIVAEMRQEVEK